MKKQKKGKTKDINCSIIIFKDRITMAVIFKNIIYKVYEICNSAR